MNEGLVPGPTFRGIVEAAYRSVSLQIWGLRIVAILVVAWLVIYFSRSLRFSRGAQFRSRPSDSSGLAGRYTPTVSVIILTLDGQLGRWVARSRYRRQEIIVAAPRGVVIRGLRPSRIRVVRAETTSEHELLAVALRRAHGEISVLVPPNHAFGADVVSHLVAPFVSAFIGATVGRTTAEARGLRFVEYVDRVSRHVCATGAHAFGAVVVPEWEPFAVRTNLGREVIEEQAAAEEPWAAIALSVAAIGFAISYVPNAMFLVSASKAHIRFARSSARLRSRRLVYRSLRATIRKGKVLEGPEKTDIRWATRGAIAPIVMAAAWVIVLALRTFDSSPIPEVLASVLILGMYATPLTFQSGATLAIAASQSGPIAMLALIPLLPAISIGVMWSGCWALLNRRPKFARPSVKPRRSEKSKAKAQPA